MTDTEPVPTPNPAAFLTVILPRVRLHARIRFRHLRCPAARDDAVAEVIALSWVWFVRLVKRGKDPSTFPAAISTFAARQVACGRRVCGQEPATEALSMIARVVGRVTVKPLDETGLEEALHDNTQTPVPEQVQFRVDFPRWIRTQTRRNRKAIHFLMTGHRTDEVARKVGVSSSRVSQLRREFAEDWKRFCESAPAAGGDHAPSR